MGATDALKLPIPELTETADGPDAFSDLANAVEDYVYDRVLPIGVSRAPSHHWGSGTALPTAAGGLKVGDTYTHTGLGTDGCLMRYSVAGWRQAEVPRFASIAALTAAVTNYAALFYRGFDAFQEDRLYRRKYDGQAWIYAGTYADPDTADAAPGDYPTASWRSTAFPAPHNTVTPIKNWDAGRVDSSVATYDNVTGLFTFAERGLYRVHLEVFSDAGYKRNSIIFSPMPGNAQSGNGGVLEDCRYVDGTAAFPNCGQLRQTLTDSYYAEQGWTMNWSVLQANSSSASVGHDFYFTISKLPG